MFIQRRVPAGKINSSFLGELRSLANSTQIICVPNL